MDDYDQLPSGKRIKIKMLVHSNLAMQASTEEIYIDTTSSIINLKVN